MDPTMTLMALRAALRRWDELGTVHGELMGMAGEQEAAEALLDAGQAIRDAAGALDEWMTGGGFAPIAWNLQAPTRDLYPSAE